jgi:hypothetical protein
MKHTTRTRHGNEMIVVDVSIEVSPAVVDFSDILNTARLEPDNDSGPPWKDGDGWDHEFWLTTIPEQRNARAYTRGHGLMCFNKSAGLPDYAYYRSQGASKGAARQLEAQALRRNIETLKGWYEDDWHYVGVVLEFKHGGETYEESCWGIDDEKHAMSEAAPDLAYQIASQLEKDGFEVINKPDRRAEYLKARKEEHQRRLNQFNMTPR